MQASLHAHKCFGLYLCVICSVPDGEVDRDVELEHFKEPKRADEREEGAVVLGTDARVEVQAMVVKVRHALKQTNTKTKIQPQQTNELCTRRSSENTQRQNSDRTQRSAGKGTLRQSWQCFVKGSIWMRHLRHIRCPLDAARSSSSSVSFTAALSRTLSCAGSRVETCRANVDSPDTKTFPSVMHSCTSSGCFHTPAYHVERGHPNADETAPDAPVDVVSVAKGKARPISRRRGRADQKSIGRKHLTSSGRLRTACTASERWRRKRESATTR